MVLGKLGIRFGFVALSLVACGGNSRESGRHRKKIEKKRNDSLAKRSNVA